MPLKRPLMTLALTAATAWAAMAARLRAEGPDDGATRVVLPTFGGKQFWTDVLLFHDWRIQRNSWDGHFRLLDGANFCHASGRYDQCAAVLERIKTRQQLPPMRGKAVILLHGLCRARSSMGKLADYLRERGGYTVFNFSYASTQAEIADPARALKQVLDHLDGIEEVNFVGHSLGNLVVRHYLGDCTHHAPRDVGTLRGQESNQSNAHRAERDGYKQGPDPRIRRFVMLAPPNYQPLLAVKFGNLGLYKLVAGEAGQQLGPEWDYLERRLATPRCEFGILAGGRGNDRGYNPLLPGDNDGTVTVESTRLCGAADFRLVHSGHTFIMEDDAVLRYTLRFLECGSFTREEERQPVGRR